MAEFHQKLQQQAQDMAQLTSQVDAAVHSQAEAQQQLNTWQEKCARLEAQSKWHLHICLPMGCGLTLMLLFVKRAS